jgi:hypothetical protein
MERTAGCHPPPVGPAIRTWLSFAIVLSLLLLAPAGSGAQSSGTKTTEKGGSGTTSGKAKKGTSKKKPKSGSPQKQAPKEKKGTGGVKTSARGEKKEAAASETLKASQEPVEKAGPEKPDEDERVGKMPDGRAVYAGSRGGHYYMNEGGTKVYVKEFEGAKIVGTTTGGQSIYEGPRGGHYYYNLNGNKVYVPNERK